MRQSYLAIADCSGLQLLVPEHDHVNRFLMRRAVRQQAACLWVVLEVAHYQRVRAELIAGERRSALHSLELLAFDFGLLIFQELDSADFAS